jgi:hypothetical protein
MGAEGTTTEVGAIETTTELGAREIYTLSSEEEGEEEGKMSDKSEENPEKRDKEIRRDIFSSPHLGHVSHKGAGGASIKSSSGIGIL